MRNLLYSLVTCLLFGSVAHAQAVDPQLMAPITKFVDAFNKGDMAGAAATHVADAETFILDEVPPFMWVGAKAFEAWAAALDADAKQQGMTEPTVKLGTATRAEVSGDHAYVVAPVTFTFKAKGVPMREAAQI